MCFLAETPELLRLIDWLGFQYNVVFTSSELYTSSSRMSGTCRKKEVKLTCPGKHLLMKARRGRERERDHSTAIIQFDSQLIHVVKDFFFHLYR